MRIAILQIADQGPAESTALMLRSVGYECYLPDKPLRDLLRMTGCDTVLSPRDLARSMGYDAVDLPEIGPGVMDTADLYCDVKAHRNHDKITRRWPNLEGKVLWTRINGGKPEIVPGHGDEINPPCPVLTPNLWYREHERAYACWPPFNRWDDYAHARNRGQFKMNSYTAPICLVHNLPGWGYGSLQGPLKRLGVAMHGAGSPDGLVHHREIPVRLTNTLCMVHLKSSDAPGYALYEALAAGCPIVCSRRLIWRNRMQDLFTPEKTCLVFDRETHEGLTVQDVSDCTREIGEALKRLNDPAENKRIGMAGRKRLRELMWNEERDGESLRRFMEKNFG